MIKPTVGRVVWYWPALTENEVKAAQPCAALIAYVWNDRIVNLAVFTPNGVSYNETSVTLVQEGDAVPQLGRYAEWMPYQVGQAKKHETETK